MEAIVYLQQLTPDDRWRLQVIGRGRVLGYIKRPPDQGKYLYAQGHADCSRTIAVDSDLEALKRKIEAHHRAERSGVSRADTSAL